MSDPLNPVAVYVQASGSDLNDGKSWATAFQTIDKGLSYLESVGGGELHIFSNNGEVSGNIWLRGDGLAGQPSMTGWHGDFPLKVIGYGINHTSFGFPAAFINPTNGTDQRTPFIWMAGTNTTKEFVSIANSAYINTYFRAWDYRRDVSGNIVTSNITNWVRSGTTSTVTLQLPPAANVAQFTRLAGTATVQLTIDPTAVTRPGMCNLNENHVIRVVSTEPNFDSGDFVVTQAVGTLIPYVVQYTQLTSGPAATATNAGTVQWSGLAYSGRFQVASSQPGNVSTATYRVITNPTVADQVTVFDPYSNVPAGTPDGSGTIGIFPTTGSFANPGTWTLTDRFSFNSSSGQDFYNCQGLSRGSPPYDIPGNDPFLDVGAINDGRMRFYKCAPAGYSPTHGCPDPDRNFVCGLFDPGSHGATSLEMHDCRPAGGGMVFYGSKSTTDGIRLINIVGDVAFNTSAPVHMLRVTDGGLVGGSVYVVDGVRNADIEPGGYDIVIDRSPPESLIMNSGPTIAPGSVVINCDADPQGLTYWQLGHSGFWFRGSGADAFQTVVGDVPTVRRSLPLAMSRFTNLAPPDSSWNMTGGVVTTGIADPWGGTRATKVVGGGGPIILNSVSGPFNIFTGDTFVFGIWARKDGGFSGSLNFRIMDGSGIVVLVYAQASRSADWQVIKGTAVVTRNVGAALWAMDLGFSPSVTASPGFEYCQPFLEYMPVSTVSAAEAAVYAGTIGNRTRYLSPGTTGTLEGVPFIGHGGLGIDSSIPRVAGSASGQLTIGTIVSYEPRFAADGTTIIGWAPLYSATINP